MSAKLTGIVIFILFTAFAIVQYNDPDPLVWILVYGGIAVVALLHVFDQIHPVSFIIMMIVYALYAVVYFPGVIEWLVQPNKAELFGEMNPDKMYLEETREFFGLILGVIALFLLYKSRNRSAL